MPIISQKDQDILRKKFEIDLRKDVYLALFTQKQTGLIVPGRDCRTCGETQKLLQELTSLSPRLHLDIYDFYNQPEEVKVRAVERIPAVILGSDRHNGVKFYGIPSGYEFSTLIDDIIALAKGQSPLKLDTRKKLNKLKEPVHIKVFVTPT
ncbi:MAG: thioredoxin family protein [Chloroflexi bacterium]|nr:thioredoxin family protein [Chloroflexota bacterium]